jgi:hypothetical protein
MHGELARKQPAQVIDSRPALVDYPRAERWSVGPYAKVELAKEVHRMASRGEIARGYVIRQIRGGWVAEYTRLKPGPPAWRKPLLIGVSAAGALLGLLWLIVWIVKAVLAAIVAAAPTLAMGLVILLIVSVLAGGGAITVIQKVTIRR